MCKHPQPQPLKCFSAMFTTLRSARSLSARSPNPRPMAICIGVILLYRDNGKEHGNYYNIMLYYSIFVYYIVRYIYIYSTILYHMNWHRMSQALDVTLDLLLSTVWLRFSGWVESKLRILVMQLEAVRSPNLGACGGGVLGSRCWGLGSSTPTVFLKTSLSSHRLCDLPGHSCQVWMLSP